MALRVPGPVLGTDLVVAGRVIDADSKCAIAAEVVSGNELVTCTQDGRFAIVVGRADLVTFRSPSYRPIERPAIELSAELVVELFVDRSTTILAVDEEGQSVDGASVFCWEEAAQWSASTNPPAARLVGATDASGRFTGRLSPWSVVMLATRELSSYPTPVLEAVHHVVLARGGWVGIHGYVDAAVSVTLEVPFRTPRLLLNSDATGVVRISLRAGTYQVLATDLGVGATLNVEEGVTNWVTPRSMESLVVDVLDATTGDVIRNRRCVVEAILEYPDRPPVPTGTTFLDTGPNGQVRLPVNTHAARGRASLGFRVSVVGYETGSVRLGRDGNTRGSVQVRLQPDKATTRVVIHGEEGLDVEFEIGRKSSPELVLGHLSLRGGQGTCEIQGTVTPNDLWIRKDGVHINVEEVSIQAKESRIDVDLQGILAHLTCRNAPADLVLVGGVASVPGRGVGTRQVAWTALPPGDYVLMRERFLAAGASDCGVAVTVSRGSKLTLDWSTATMTGQVVRDSNIPGSARVIVAPLIQAGDKVRVATGLGVSPGLDGSYSISDISTDAIAVCYLRRGAWDVMATARQRETVYLMKPTGLVLEGKILDSILPIMPATAALHRRDVLGRVIIGTSLRPVERAIDGRLHVPEVPDCVSEIVFSGQGRRLVVCRVGGVFEISK